MKITDKIKDYKQRNHDEFVTSMIDRLTVIQILINEKKKLQFSEHKFVLENEFLKYVPVSIVSCFEDFFKRLISEYIDSNDFYLEKSLEIFKKNKIDIDIFKGLRSKHFSIGELIAFSLSYSSFDTIKENFRLVSGTELLDKLSNITTNDLFQKEVTDPDLEKSKSQIKEEQNELYRIYNVRHIICHEFGAKIEIDTVETNKMLEVAILFLKGVNRVLLDDLYKDYPWSQSEMNTVAAESLFDAENQYKLLLQRFEKRFPEKVSEFKSFSDKWEESIKNNAKFYADFYAEGGSMRSLLYSTHLEKQYTEKNIEIENMLKN